jgi:hypothetical protein
MTNAFIWEYSSTDLNNHIVRFRNFGRVLNIGQVDYLTVESDIVKSVSLSKRFKKLGAKTDHHQHYERIIRLTLVQLEVDA